MHATTLQFRKVVHKVLDAAQLKCDWSYTDKPKIAPVFGQEAKRYVGLSVHFPSATVREAVLADINAQLAALGVTTRAECRSFHIRGICRPVK